MLHKLLPFYSEICKSRDDRSKKDGVHLDFCKAFDSVPYKELSLQIMGYGHDWPFMAVFRAHLMNPSHFSCINNTSSRLLPVYSCVHTRVASLSHCYSSYTSMTYPRLSLIILCFSLQMMPSYLNQFLHSVITLYFNWTWTL